MKKQRSMSEPMVGGSSLLTIFSVLCLCVFSLLSFVTVQAEKRLSDVAAAAVTEYYRADMEAEKIFARLRRDETVSGVFEEAGIYSYACPISASQTLEVELQREVESWRVLRWQVVAQPEALRETLPVWNGA